MSLHHIIRESDKPYAEKIAAFERYFDKCRKDPENFKVTSKQMRDYKRLLHDASIEELAHYEVIFATCAVGGSPKLIKATKGSIFQVRRILFCVFVCLFLKDSIVYYSNCGGSALYMIGLVQSKS